MVTTQFKVENYLANSFVTVEGKKNADNFYIIRSGKVKLQKENPVVADECPTTGALGTEELRGRMRFGHSRLKVDTGWHNGLNQFD